MIVGGIVGSNIFNILSVLALSAAVKPLVINPRFAAFDLPVAVTVTVVFAGVPTLWQPDRPHGGLGDADVLHLLCDGAIHARRCLYVSLVLRPPTSRLI